MDHLQEEGEEDEEGEEEEKEGEEEEEEEEDEDEEYDAGSEDYSLESYGISIDTTNTVTFAIAVKSLFEKPIRNVTITKTIPGDFSNTDVIDVTIGNTDISGDQLVWTIDSLDPELSVES